MLDPAFEELWKRISQRTRYRVSFSTESLVNIASERIKQMPKIFPLRIDMDKVMMLHTQAGIEASNVIETKFAALAGKNAPLPDLLAYLQNETELTRHTLVEILLRSARLGDFEINPQAFITMTITELNKTLHDLILDGIHYEKIVDQHWEMHRLEDGGEEGLLRYLNNLYEVQNKNKSPYDYVEFDSEIERNFACDLDNNEKVKLFVKLPAWFTVDTPLGHYNPDWAIVLEEGEQLYLVRETKSTLDEDKLRKEENAKLACGRKHFKAIDVDFDVAINLRDILHKLAKN
jgi:type III restriction enzyme